MDAQDFRSLQEAYMEVVENRQLDEISSELAKRAGEERMNRTLDLMQKDWEEGRKTPSPEFQKSYKKLQDDEKRYRRKLKKEQADLYDIILSHLLDEGYAETVEAAESMMVHMSEEWRDSICEEYKKLPVGKMMWKVSDRAEREADTRAERERQADDPHSTLNYDRARAEHEKAERNKERSNKMIRVADAHSKKAAKAKSKFKK